jgi:putative hydrolase of the HAD superfamily
MDRTEVISFDLEGTLVTPDFSQAVWHEGIPQLYASQKGIAFEEAKATVLKEYEKIGDQRREWYDIRYWFSFFGFGEYRKVLEKYRDQVSHFADVAPTLSSLSRKYTNHH